MERNVCVEIQKETGSGLKLSQTKKFPLLKSPNWSGLLVLLVWSTDTTGTIGPLVLLVH